MSLFFPMFHSSYLSFHASAVYASAPNWYDDHHSSWPGFLFFFFLFSWRFCWFDPLCLSCSSVSSGASASSYYCLIFALSLFCVVFLLCCVFLFVSSICCLTFRVSMRLLCICVIVRARLVLFFLLLLRMLLHLTVKAAPWKAPRETDFSNSGIAPTKRNP